MTVKLDLPPELIQKLQEAAAHSGVDLDHFVAEALREHVRSVPKTEADRDAWLTRFRRWADSFPQVTTLDDSRDSIYPDRF